jgi:hypothetical protein
MYSIGWVCVCVILHAKAASHIAEVLALELFGKRIARPVKEIQKRSWSAVNFHLRTLERSSYSHAFLSDNECGESVAMDLWRLAVI